MANNKLNRTNDDIQYVLAKLLPQIKDPRVNQGALLSITRVDTTGDLRYSKIYVSALGELDEKAFRKGIKSASPWLRHELGTALNLRYTPELVFERDRSIEQGAKLTRLIDEVMAGENREEAQEDEHDAE